MNSKFIIIFFFLELMFYLSFSYHFIHFLNFNFQIFVDFMLNK